MLWEGRPLRDIRENDVRRLIDSGLTEHLQLEYKGALYDDSDRGKREFLLDVCMFANAAGGIVLLGVPERRDEQGQPTGAPDPDGVLGLDVPNPEAVLNAYDARVMEAVEERLALETVPVVLGGGRRVLAIRVPNSANKPHSVRHQGHIYFPSRRERQRYNMTVREIKDLVMKTAGRLQQAEDLLQKSFLEVARPTPLPYLLIGIIPAFFADFLIDVRGESVRRAVAMFSRAGQPVYGNVGYVFDGLERRENAYEFTVRLRRDGLLSASLQLPVTPIPGEGNGHILYPASIEGHLRSFVLRSIAVYEAAGIGAPYVLGMMFRLQQPLVGGYAAMGGLGEDRTPPIPARDYRFPCMTIDDLSSTDSVIRPFCDQAHQMFGREGSPSFDAEGAWIAR